MNQAKNIQDERDGAEALVGLTSAISGAAVLFAAAAAGCLAEIFGSLVGWLGGALLCTGTAVGMALASATLCQRKRLRLRRGA